MALSTGRDAHSARAVRPLGLHPGDAAQATRLAARPRQTRSQKTRIVQFNYMPSIHAAVALQEGSASRAIEALVPATPYELGSCGWPFTFVLYSHSTCAAKLM